MDLTDKGSTDARNSYLIHTGTWLVLGLSVLAYIYIGYFLSRKDFFLFISVYLLLFAGYIYLMRRNAWQGQLLTRYKNIDGLSPDSAGILLNRKSDVRILIGAAILFRVCFLLSLPSLSDDYFRFIWDGTMWSTGQNPYTILPSLRMLSGHQPTNDLMQVYAGMNSPDYFTVYPPVCQFIFALAVKLFPGNLPASIIMIRLFCIAAEVGTICLLQKILALFNQPKRNALLYALNPLVIIELSGNIHFEALMIFFIVLSAYLLIQFTEKKVDPFLEEEVPLEKKKSRKLIFSAIGFSLAIACKLIPLIFLPFLIRRLKWKVSAVYFSTITIALILLFLPFINHQLLTQLFTSLNLYFQKFEFNGSVFYLIRWVGFQWKGYDVIQSAGLWLAFITFVSILFLAVKEKDLSWKKFFLSMQWSLTIYFLMATTVHPWYLTTLVMLSVITGYQYPIVWSLFIALSYATYKSVPYHENLLFVAVEYLMVIGVMVWEIRSRNMNVYHAK